MAEFFDGLLLTSWREALVSVGLAILFGFVIGYDRNSKNKPVDFRVFMIVCVTTCLVGLMAEELYALHKASDDMIQLDLAKVIEGTLVGIGFLGSGAIIKRRDDHVLGTATAASIWAAGGIGLMLGFKVYGLAIMGFVAMVVILMGFGYLRKPLFGDSEVYPCNRVPPSDAVD